MKKRKFYFEANGVVLFGGEPSDCRDEDVDNIISKETNVFPIGE